jgi:hypothetical protein
MGAISTHDSTARRGLGRGQHGEPAEIKIDVWRTIHLAVDAVASEIEAALLTEAGVHNADVAPLLSAQLDRPLASVGADGASDRKTVYDTLAAQAPHATIAIPPRRDAKIQQHGSSQAPWRVCDVNLRYTLRGQHGQAKWRREHG